MKRSTKNVAPALRVVARSDRHAIERAVKDMFADQGQLVLPILSLVTEARAQIDDVLGEVNRQVLESILLASAHEIAGAKTPGRASGKVRWYGTRGGRVSLADRQLQLRRPRLRADEGKKKLRTHAAWLKPDHADAAASLLEGLDEMFPVNDLGLTPPLIRCLGTTNIAENPNGTLRVIMRRVSRWRDRDMIE